VDTFFGSVGDPLEDMSPQRLKIAVVAPPWLPVPPERYGGVEWIVSLLADRLAELGHDVTLYACGGSITQANLVTTSDDANLARYGQLLPELEHALLAFRDAGRYDVISDHSGMAAAAIADLVPTPVVHTVHSPLTDEPGRMYRLIAERNPRLRFISTSLKQREPAEDLPWIANCPSALDLDAYPFADRRGDYLLFLGRMSPEKGAARAITVAREMALPLKLAGKMHEADERAYFSREIAPHLSDRIEYLGEVAHEDKVRLLQRARCTLFPIDWEEPFGLVMLESMACGTPVVAMRRGAVSEVIAPGASGVIVDRLEDFPGAVAQADAIEPGSCRDHVESNFSEVRMVRSYLDAFAAILG
jgi:glycosyltransferase involved in cell wall biosynthesis